MARKKAAEAAAVRRDEKFAAEYGGLSGSPDGAAAGASGGSPWGSGGAGGGANGKICCD